MKHGAKRRGAATTEYNSWAHMISRCHDPNDKRYCYYGARGITVCERWRGEEGFANFLADMGVRPSGMRSIERKNNDKGYEPDNCVWSTYYVQCRNRRSNRMVTIGDETLCVTDWARRNGILVRTAFNRLHLGWDPVEAVTIPVGARSGRFVSGPKGSRNA